MKHLRGVIRALAGLGLVLALIGAALVLAPPYVVRYAVIHYLASQGIDAHIGHVETNLLTGEITLDDARGTVDGQPVFDIGHLALGLDYPALLDQRINLTHLDIRNSSVEVRRSADNHIRVAGIQVLPAQKQNTQSRWGFGLSKLRLGQLTVDYNQPASKQHAAIHRQITFNDSSATDAHTWQPDNDTPLDADISVGDSRLKIAGHITPFGKRLSAELHLQTTRLSLDLLSPIAAGIGLDHLTGTIDSDQRIEARYAPGSGLDLSIDGSIAWQNALLSRGDGLTVQSPKLSWQGHTQAHLLKARQQAAHINAQGRLTLGGLAASQPNTFNFRQAEGGWQGKANITLADDATTIDTHGTLATHHTRLTAVDRLRLTSSQSTLNGDLTTRLGAQSTQIQTNGSFKAQGMTFSVPKSVNFDSQQLDWQGQTTTELEASATRIHTDGHMNVNALGFQVPRSTQFHSQQATWRGTTDIHSADLFERAVNGTLAVTDAQLDITGVPMHLSAERVAYQGRYAEQANANHSALRLVMDGDLNSHQFRVQNTTIDAPWFVAQQLHADKLSIDGLDRIRLPALYTSGVRILGDTDTSSAVLQAVSLDAKALSLKDLAHYSADSIQIKDAIMHTRRTSKGLGVISEFFGTSKQAKDPAKDKTESSTTANKRIGSTFALKHFSLSGPSIAFVDTAVTPHVNLHGLDVNLSIDGLDTASPERDAEYRLSLDVGAYGHLDSRGKIAPMARNGINMDLDAWLRSLAMAPVSGYLNAAMGRKIANGAADGTLHLEAKDGKLNGLLDTTLSNFRVANSEQKTTDIAYGISLDSALVLIRGQNDLINFKTKILGDVTNPYFSIKNLVREAVLAGLRTALLSDFSPVGLLNRAKNAFLNLFRSISDYPATFEPGYHYIRPEDRKYLGLLAQYMYRNPKITLTVQGHANPGDHDAMSHFKGPRLDGETQLSLTELARQRGEAVRDYLAARNVNPARVELLKPVVDDSADAKPRATFTLDKP